LGKQQKLSKFLQNNVHGNNGKYNSMQDVYNIHQEGASKIKRHCSSRDLNTLQTEKNVTKQKASKSNQKNITSYFIKSGNDKDKLTSSISNEALANNSTSEYCGKADKEMLNDYTLSEEINQREKCSREWKSLMSGRIKKELRSSELFRTQGALCS